MFQKIITSNLLSPFDNTFRRTMSDSHYCHVHWRVTELINVDTEWESEELPDDGKS